MSDCGFKFIARGHRRGRAWLLALWLLAPAGNAADLAAGPMLGYATMKEVAVWVQPATRASVALRYWPEGRPDSAVTTESVVSDERVAHAATLVAGNLEPGRHYRYQVLLDGRAASDELRFATQPLWQWRGDPPPFRFALGSCAYVNDPPVDRPGTPYGSNYSIFEHIADARPAFMLWLGDNTYLREADWNSRSGIFQRYSHTRALPELARLLRSAHHYATWDDHDFGPNNSDRSFWNRDITLEAFKAFWPNPNFDVTGAGGLTGSFQWHDVQFFLLDNRWFRAPNERVTGQAQIFGPDQVRWLVDALTASQASFKFVVTAGAFLADYREQESAIHVAPEERRHVLDRLAAEAIPGVIFLSGDDHQSRLVRLDRDGAYPLYEWTVSPLTAGVSSLIEVGNVVAGSQLAEHNFGLIDVTGPREDRRLELRLVNARGQQRWRFELAARDLCAPAACELGH